MRIHPRRAISVSVALVAAGLVNAPMASAACNDSSGTTVCAQGDIRGTHGPPPAQPELGSYGTWCNANVCFNNGRFGIFGP